MSLILEALKKLDKEKGVPERGFAVVAAEPWPSRTRPPLGALLAVGVLLATGIAVGLALRSRPQPQATGAAAAVAPVKTLAARAVDLTPPAPPLPGPTTVPARAAEPMFRPAPATPAPVDLRLQAISERDGRPVAVVNEHVVHEGDQFDDILVIRIGPAEVEVEVRGKRRILTF